MGDIQVFFLFYLPQSVLFMWAGLLFFRVSRSVSKVIVMSFVFALCIWAVRGIYTYFNFLFGTHTLVLLIIAVLILRFIGRTNWLISVGISVMSMMLIVLGSQISHFILNYLNITPEQVLSNSWLHIAIGYFENLLLILVILANKLLGFQLPDIFMSEAPSLKD